jgi:hypothetical protein
MLCQEVSKNEILWVDANLVPSFAARHLVVVVAVADSGIYIAIGEF